MGTYSPATLPILSHTNYDAFTNRITSLNNPNLINYHNATRYRLDICEYCVKLLLANYNNGVEFATGWTGFLVQGKATIDSFSEEVNLRYSLHISKPNWATNIERLVANLAVLRSQNSQLAQLIDVEFGRSSSWFTEFKNLRDSDGVHRTRINRNLIITIGAQRHRIQIRGHDVDVYSTDTILRINKILESSYNLM